MMKKERKYKYKGLVAVLTVFVGVAILFMVLDYYGSSDSPPVYPDYGQIGLEDTMNLKEVYEGNIDEKTERLLFLQTGLGIEGVERARDMCSSEAEFCDKLKQYQRQLFEGVGEKQVVDLKTGDILVSMSQRFCFYPHGHAAIVIDGKENRILEARSYRAGSCVCNLSKWSKLSSFVVLRVKEEVIGELEKNGNENPANKAAVYAAQNLSGLKYSLLKDLRPFNESVPEYTQCAHLVWYAYFAVGLDIDENRGLIVKPKDFLKSDVLEIVQVFGMKPDKLLQIHNE